MATNPLARLAPSPSTRSFDPLPPFEIPALPERLHRIAPDDSSAWHAAITEAVRQQFRLLEAKINAIIDGRTTTNTTVINEAGGRKGDKGDKGDTGVAGTNGSPGADGEDGTTWHDGSGVPDDSLGVDGDYYLDVVTGDVYLKELGTWV